MSELGARIGAAVRERRRVSQAQLAERLGVSKMAVSHWERGQQVPSVARLIELCAALECTPNDLLMPDGESDPALLVNLLAE